MRDLLRPQKLKKLPQQNLKVREHPKEGPYVEGRLQYLKAMHLKSALILVKAVWFFVVAGLTKQHVSDLDSIEVLIEQGNKLRFVLCYLQIFLV